MWMAGIYTNQQAFAYNQKPLKRIPRICQLPEQQCYAIYLFFNYNTFNAVKNCIKGLWVKHIHSQRNTHAVYNIIVQIYLLYTTVK